MNTESACFPHGGTWAGQHVGKALQAPTHPQGGWKTYLSKKQKSAQACTNTQCKNARSAEGSLKDEEQPDSDLGKTKSTEHVCGERVPLHRRGSEGLRPGLPGTEQPEAQSVLRGRAAGTTVRGTQQGEERWGLEKP